MNSATVDNMDDTKIGESPVILTEGEAPVEAQQTPPEMNLEDVERVLQGGLKANWKQRVDAMTQLGKSCNSPDMDQEQFHAVFGKFVPLLCGQLKDGRSAVVKEASSVITEITRNRRDQVTPFAPVLVDKLSDLLKITIKVISLSADNCIKSVVQNVRDTEDHQLLRTLISQTGSKNHKTRSHCFGYIRLQLSSFCAPNQSEKKVEIVDMDTTEDDLPPLEVEEDDDLPELEESRARYLGLVETAIANGVTDASAEVRNAALWCLADFHKLDSSRGDRLLSSLIPAARQKFDAELATTTPFMNVGSPKKSPKRKRVKRAPLRRKFSSKVSKHDPLENFELKVASPVKGGNSSVFFGRGGGRGVSFEMKTSSDGYVLPPEQSTEQEDNPMTISESDATAEQNSEHASNSSSMDSTGDTDNRMTDVNEEMQTQTDSRKDDDPPNPSHQLPPPPANKPPATAAPTSSRRGDERPIALGRSALANRHLNEVERNRNIFAALLDLEEPKLTEKMLNFICRDDVCEILMGFLSRLPANVRVGDLPQQQQQGTFHTINVDKMNPREVQNVKRSFRLMEMISPSSLSEPVSVFLSQKIEMICNHCLACWTLQSHGNIHHACRILNQLITCFPRRLLQVVQEGFTSELLLNVIYTGLHSGSTTETILNLISVPIDSEGLPSLRLSLFKVLNDSRFVETIFENICKAEVPEEVAEGYAQFFERFVTAMAIEDNTEILLNNPPDHAEQLIKVICEVDHSHKLSRRVLCARLLAHMHYKFSCPVFQSESNASVFTMFGLPPPEPNPNRFHIEYQPFTRMLVDYIENLCKALPENDRLTGSLQLSAFQVEQRFSLFKLSVLQLLVQVCSESNIKESEKQNPVDMIPLQTWSTLVDWLFNHTHNSLYLVAFRKLFEIALNQSDTIPKYVLEECQLLHKLIEFYTSHDTRCGIHSYALELSLEFQNRCSTGHKSGVLIVHKQNEPEQKHEYNGFGLKEFLKNTQCYQDFLPELDSERERQSRNPISLPEENTHTGEMGDLQAMMARIFGSAMQASESTNSEDVVDVNDDDEVYSPDFEQEAEDEYFNAPLPDPGATVEALDLEIGEAATVVVIDETEERADENGNDGESGENVKSGAQSDEMIRPEVG